MLDFKKYNFYALLLQLRLHIWSWGRMPIDFVQLEMLLLLYIDIHFNDTLTGSIFLALQLIIKYFFAVIMPAQWWSSKSGL